MCAHYTHKNALEIPHHTFSSQSRTNHNHFMFLICNRLFEIVIGAGARSVYTFFSLRLTKRKPLHREMVAKRSTKHRCSVPNTHTHKNLPTAIPRPITCHLSTVDRIMRIIFSNAILYPHCHSPSLVSYYTFK